MSTDPITLQYEWLAPKLSSGERSALSVIYGAYLAAKQLPDRTFALGDRVKKTKGSQWRGRVVGFYSSSLTPEGYAVESDTEIGSVQIYPRAALESI